MPSAAPRDTISDRSLLSVPSIDLVTCLLDLRMDFAVDRHVASRLAMALAACAQLSTLGNRPSVVSPSLHISFHWLFSN